MYRSNVVRRTREITTGPRDSDAPRFQTGDTVDVMRDGYPISTCTIKTSSKKKDQYDDDTWFYQLLDRDRVDFEQGEWVDEKSLLEGDY